MRRLSILLLAGALAPVPAAADDFPTIETVREVVQCMADLGAQIEENLYVCACRHDVIASQMTFKEYEHVVTFERMRSMPGERGGVIRDVQRRDDLIKRAGEARKLALERCPPVRHIERDPPRSE
jgi:hypothetical protein